MTKTLLPVTIVTVMLDLEDRLSAAEKVLKIKNKPFLERTLKYRQTRKRTCDCRKKKNQVCDTCQGTCGKDRR